MSFKQKFNIALILKKIRIGILKRKVILHLNIHQENTFGNILSQIQVIVTSTVKHTILTDCEVIGIFLYNTTRLFFQKEYHYYKVYTIYNMSESTLISSITNRF